MNKCKCGKELGKTTKQCQSCYLNRLHKDVDRIIKICIKKRGNYKKENNPNWKGGYKNHLPNCKDCNKKLSNKNAIRCCSCAKKYQYKVNPESYTMFGKMGKLAGNYKDGRTFKNNYFKIYKRNRLKLDINYKIRCNLATRIWYALKDICKSKSTEKLLGCNIDFLREHLQKQFKPGMSWSNYGKWHIDHIKPCASFNLNKPNEQKKCFHYKNLQPLWAKDNRIKSNKFLILKEEKEL
jgi:hypothetical protein